MQDSLDELYDHSVFVAQNFQRCEVAVIKVLQEIDHQKLFASYDYRSLYHFASEVMKFSPANACSFITVSRKSRKVPQLLEAIGDRRISTNAARRICPVINSENYENWIQTAEELTHRQLERKVALEKPEKSTDDQYRYTSGDRVEMTLGLSETLMKKFKYVQDLVSQKEKKAASYEKTLAAMIHLYLEKKDPIAKAERVFKRKQKNNADASGMCRKTQKQPRSKVPKLVAHKVKERDGNQCRYRNFEGERCASHRWIEIHHVIPKSRGGADTVENLACLCRFHHQRIHQNSISVRNFS